MNDDDDDGQGSLFEPEVQADKPVTDHEYARTHTGFCDVCGKPERLHTRLPAPAIPIAQARAERDEAMAAVELAASEAWNAMAWDWLCEYLRCHREFFPDDVWQAGLEVPRERRAFGPLVARASKRGMIRKTERRRQRTRGHATDAIVWESMVYREGASVRV